MKFFSRILLYLALHGAALAAFATGPSSIRIELTPLAASSDGVVLFKAVRHDEPSGIAGDFERRFYWVAASASGGILNAIPFGSERAVEGKAKLRGEAARSLSGTSADALAWQPALDNPPASLARLMSRYGITAAQAVNASTGAGSVTWSPTMKQQSLRGLRNVDGQGTPVKATFCAHGVALFRNRDDAQGEEGAIFDVKSRRAPYGIYDYRVIDGIAIVPGGCNTPGG